MLGLQWRISPSSDLTELHSYWAPHARSHMSIIYCFWQRKRNKGRRVLAKNLDVRSKVIGLEREVSGREMKINS